MGQIEDLAKLAELKNNGIISEEEYETQKQIILSANANRQPREGQNLSPKSGIAYAILGFFFGFLGLHNYYIGRWKRATVQLLLTWGGLPILIWGGSNYNIPAVVFGIGWIFVGLLINGFWVPINLFAMKTDGKGRALVINLGFRVVLGVLLLLFFLVSVLLGGLAGYTQAMNRHRALSETSYTQPASAVNLQAPQQAKLVLNYTIRCAIAAVKQNGNGVVTAKTCEEVLPAQMIDGDEYEIEDTPNALIIETAPIDVEVRQLLLTQKMNVVQVQEDDDSLKFIFPKQ